MNKLALADMHIHSIRSFDGHDSVEDICRAAVKAGIKTIAVTDHYECGSPDSPDQCEPERIDLSVADVTAQIGKHGELEVLRGVELGQPHCDMETADRILHANEYDFVLGSVHYVKNGGDLYWFNYKERDPYEVYDQYINEVLKTAADCEFDSLAHMTYPLRYMIYRDGAVMDTSRYTDIYDAILDAIIKRGKALEVNTKLIEDPGGFFTPDEPILRRYYKKGGRLITLGSDSHYASLIGTGITRAADALRECGFDSYFIYRNRQPVEIPLGE